MMPARHSMRAATFEIPSINHVSLTLNPTISLKRRTAKDNVFDDVLLSSSQRLWTLELTTAKFIPSIALRTLVYIATLPYYRFFRSNTLKPIVHIAQYTSKGPQVSTLAGLLAKWRSRKLSELHFISVAVGLLVYPFSPFAS